MFRKAMFISLRIPVVSRSLMKNITGFDLDLGSFLFLLGMVFLDVYMSCSGPQRLQRWLSSCC